MSISQACIHDGDLIGVVGVDLHMEDIAQDITYFNQEEDSYAFIINTDGKQQKLSPLVLFIHLFLKDLILMILKNLKKGGVKFGRFLNFFKIIF